MSIQNYAANTNNAFLLNDTVVIAQALLKGLDPTQIQRQASEGLLEHRSRLSRQTFAREILKRLNGSEVELLEFFLGNSELRRVANLYTILRHHRLYVNSLLKCFKTSALILIIFCDPRM